MWRSAFAVVVAVVFVSSTAFAKTCTVGSPCGNTCISARDVCHVGSGGGLALTDEQLALGIGFTTGAVVFFGVALWQGVNAEYVCPSMASDQICWPRFWQISGYVLSAGFAIAAIAVFAQGAGQGNSVSGLSVAVPL